MNCCDDAAKYAELKKAVLEHLDELIEDEEKGARPGWPDRLEELVGWQDKGLNKEQEEQWAKVLNALSGGQP